MRDRDWFLELPFRLRLGFQSSRVCIDGAPYLDRYIVYLFGATLRLHRFWRGDDHRASHTHPWWFVTIPFTTYYEAVYDQGTLETVRCVRAWIPHFRGERFEHIVLGRPLIADEPDLRPFWTFVVTGFRTQDWGFYPSPGKFVPWRDWSTHVRG